MQQANFGADLWEILDGGETILYRRAGSAEERRIEGALRRPAKASRGSAADVAGTADLLWHVPAQEGWHPSPGDHIISREGRRWTVLKAELLAGEHRWRLTTRDLAAAYGLRRHVTVETLLPYQRPDGTPAGRWRVWKSGIRAAVQRWEAHLGRNHRPSYERRYRIVLEECPPTDSRLRLRTASGKILAVLSVQPPSRADELTTVEAVQLD
jgi:hypothetical protein